MGFVKIVNNVVSNNTFFDITNNMYELFTSEQFDCDVSIYDGFQDLIDTLYEIHNQKAPNKTILSLDNKYVIESNNKVTLEFSGGLDSVYSALYLKDKGYDVTLLHFDGINKNMPRETEFAINFANKFGFKIECVKVSQPKQFFIDNPIKNQLIASYIIDYNIQNNIGNIANGDSYFDETIEEATIGQTITDTKEVWEKFFNGISRYVDNINCIYVDENITKYKELEYILNNHKDAIENIYSCINPHRFNNMLNKSNSEKYNIPLMYGRCGSCYKCCMEFILLSELGYYDKNDDNVKKYIKHCWDIISSSKLSSDSMRINFNKKVSEEDKIKKIKEIKP